jgi:hypothetical protein
MCPVTPNPPPSAGGLPSRHVPSGSRPLSVLMHFRRCLTSNPSWPRQSRGADITLNAYVTGHTERMTGIKCVQDIDAAGR